MKTLKFILVLLFLFVYGDSNAQFFKKLKKRAEEAAKETIFQKSEEEASRRSGQAMDSIFKQPDKIGKKKRDRENGQTNDDTMTMDEYPNDGMGMEPENIINRNFDFVPGNKTLFYDDFGPDQLGDFPSKWDTNGSGELIEINGEKWFKLKNNSTFIPMYDGQLPENYSISFDLFTNGMDHKTSSQAWIVLQFVDNNLYKKSKTFSSVDISPCQFIDSPGYLQKTVNGERHFFNNVGKDYREEILGQSRISILANGTRLRIWLNENKLVDIPRMLHQDMGYFKIFVRGFRDGDNLDEVFIKDFRLAETVEDNRSKLLTEGSLSTSSILFESGSAILQSEDNEIIDEVAHVMMENGDVSIAIIGHTDDEGSEESNLTLSKNRANSVKSILVNRYGIDSARIETDGMGESQPVSENSTIEGKAQNRRVEFIKI